MKTNKRGSTDFYHFPVDETDKVMADMKKAAETDNLAGLKRSARLLMWLFRAFKNDPCGSDEPFKFELGKQEPPMFNREKILELEIKCKCLAQENETYKKTLKELDEMEAAKKRIEAEFFTPEEAGGIYDQLRKNGVDVIDMDQPVNFFNGKFCRPYFTLSQTIEYKDLQKIISEAGWEMYGFSVINGQIRFSIKKPEDRQ